MTPQEEFEQIWTDWDCQDPAPLYDHVRLLIERISQQPESVEKVLAVVNEQAEDEALWGVPVGRLQSIVEAYLQQELRRLHQVIEDEFEE